MDDFNTRMKRTYTAAEYAAGWMAVFVVAALIGIGLLVVLRPWE